MKYHTIVATVGVSALTPNNLGHRWVKERLDGAIAPSGRSWELLTSVEAALALAERAPLLDVGSPKNVSAEYSLLHALRSAGRLAPSPTVYLVHTDSLDGRLAAMFDKRMLEQDFGARVVLREVSDLNPASPVAMRRALGGYLAALAEYLQDAPPHGTAFAPLGGYKVMTSLGYLAGALFGFGTLYLFEDAQHLIEVPAVPLDVSPERLADVRPLFWRVRDEDVIRIEALEQPERERVDAFPWLFDRVDDDVAVGPFADLLLESPAHRGALQRAVVVAAEVPDNEGSRAAIERLLAELAKGARGDLLFHERDFGHRATDFHVFKTRSDGKYRAAWRLESPDRLQVRRVWVDDHDGYEREVPAGHVLRNSGGIRWKPWV